MASTSAQQKSVAAWRLRLGVLATGLVGTVLILGALTFSRTQTTRYEDRLDHIEIELNQPLRLLSAAQTGYRRTQQTFEDAVRAATKESTAADLAVSLNEAAAAKRAWTEFEATPVRFEGEEAARAATDAAIAANDAAGQQLGLAVLNGSAGADASAIDNLELVQRGTSEQVQNAFEHLQIDTYQPALDSALLELRADAHQTNTSMRAALLLAAALGLLLTAAGYRRASSVERASIREQDAQDEAGAETALDARVQHALDMADTEHRAFQVIVRALADGGPAQTDFLLADTSDALFEHVAETGRSADPHCPVPSPDDCPAAKHTHHLVFTDADALDACPYLRQRDVEPGSATCVPVSIAGHAIGVIHETYPERGPVSEHRLRELEIIARKAGERLGLIRAFARSETQAQTDPLTGMLNRRSLDNAVGRLTRDGTDYSVAFADLDHFKVLNDTYGHDVGDRALRLFCTALRTSVRPDDIVARYGGEEFVILLPQCTPDQAVPVLERVQRALAIALRVEDVPPFTVSIGVASTHGGRSFEEVLLRADSSLLDAKDQGRDRIVVAEDAPAAPSTVVDLVTPAVLE